MPSEDILPARRAGEGSEPTLDGKETLSRGVPIRVGGGVLAGHSRVVQPSDRLAQGLDSPRGWKLLEEDAESVERARVLEMWAANCGVCVSG